jgi:regulatory protein
MVRFTDDPSSTDDAPLAPVTYLRPRASRTEAVEVELTPAEVRQAEVVEAEIVRESELKSADIEAIVVRALSRKDLSEWEVTQLLAANDVEQSEFEGLLVRYRTNGYVDDYAYAERHVESLHRRKGFGRSQISRELSAKHISNEIISDVLSSLDDDDELARALQLAEKRAPSLLRLDHATAERRLSAFLQRKGYPSSIVREAVTKALAPTAGGGSGKGSTVRFR